MISKDLCPRCNKIGAVIDQNKKLGLIYECFVCWEDLPFGQGEILRRSVTWANVHGEKREVIG